MHSRSIIIFIILILASVSFEHSGYTANTATAEQLEKIETKAEDTNRLNMPAVGKKSSNFTEATSGIQFVSIDGGCFSMGDTFGDGEKDERPVHRTCISAFAMSKYNVTVGQFRIFVDTTSYRTEAEKAGGCFVFNGRDWKRQAGNSWKTPGYKQNDQHPVTCVNWNDAQAYTKWLNTIGLRRYRIPTEAEWEYAARSGGQNERFAGFSDVSQLYKYANFCDSNCEMSWKTAGQNDGYKGTSPVGNFKPNALGLYDMTGNLWQWVGDWYGEKYYNKSPKDNPTGPLSGTDRVVRGGSWLNTPTDVRAADRNNCPPDYSAFDLGIRLVSSVN